MNYEYDIEGNYGQGWEVVTCEETLPEAKEMLACYNENEPGVPHRIKKVVSFSPAQRLLLEKMRATGKPVYGNPKNAL